VALTEETKVDKIEILEDGQIQVRTARVIYDDGKEISRAFHREVLDVDDARPRTGRVKAVADAVWTPEVITARKNAKAKAAQSRGA
jgi:hypothetical protein